MIASIAESKPRALICVDEFCPREGIHPRHTVRLCTDDRCDLEELHEIHEIEETLESVRQRKRRLGWKHHPLEPVVNFVKADRHAPTHFLDDVVYDHVSSVVPRSMSMILDEIHNSFGSCEERRLYRSLARLKHNQRIVHVDLSHLARNARLGVYLRPGSPLIQDPWTCLEQINDYLDHKAT